MQSQWYKLKEKAIILRKKGFSIGYVEKNLGINRSTLSGWFKNVKLTEEQKNKLLQNWKNGLIKARKKASLWHNTQRINRQEVIKKEIEVFSSNIKLDKTIREIMLATFYLAEGGKKENYFQIANSNPELLKGIITLQRNLYKLDEAKFRCALHLRKDQNEGILKKFWSEVLNIPQSQFIKTQFDKRTIKKTYDRYKGVCVLIYYDMALQRRILYLGEKLVKMANNLRA